MTTYVQASEDVSSTTAETSPSQLFGAAEAASYFNGTVVNAIFAQAGTLRTETVDEDFDFAVGFSRQPLPKGNRFAVVTNADGPGIMATDAAIRNGLELAKLRPETLETLEAKLPPTANVFSPVTCGGTFSMSKVPRAGHEIITNGVKHKLPRARSLGMESFPIITYPSLSDP
jgi:hypothetical protein